MLIAQISDCHLPADPKQKYRGIKSHKNLKNLMRKVKAMKPDLLLATGDLSEDGSRKSYRLLKQYLNLPGIPVLALPGNHDDVELLAEAFPGSPVETISVTDHGPWQIIRLNSCLPGKPEGQVSDRALKDLECLLDDGAQRPRLIAVHHQPISVGSPWIDKYPLLNPEPLLQLIDQHSDVKAVVWGHIHRAFEKQRIGQRTGTAMLGGPSSAINSLTDVQKFTEDPAGPACRWLVLGVDGTVQTGITQASD
jgi:Icc protein